MPDCGYMDVMSEVWFEGALEKIFDLDIPVPEPPIYGSNSSEQGACTTKHKKYVMPMDIWVKQASKHNIFPISVKRGKRGAYVKFDCVKDSLWDGLPEYVRYCKSGSGVEKC